MNKDPAFQRLQLLTGAQALQKLHETRVIVFGVGGVGSWCAEALARSGIGAITLVDSDLVCVTNINRQVQALSDTVGTVKVEELKRRLERINPSAAIEARQVVYNLRSADSFDLGAYDFVIDAIDSLNAKVELIMRAHQAKTTLFSALGASCKLDATRIRVVSIWDTDVCPLGRYVRKRLRRRKFDGDFKCVYSEELLPLHAAEFTCGTGDCVCPKAVRSSNPDAFVHEQCSSKKQINGSAVHITGTFGFMLAGLVIQDVVGRAQSEESFHTRGASGS